MRGAALLLIPVVLAGAAARLEAGGPTTTPADALAPLPAEAFTLEAAAHLLRRAGFGGTPEEVRALHARGPAGAVAHLVDLADAPDEGPLLADVAPIPRTPRAQMVAWTEEQRREERNRVRRADQEQLQRVREAWLRRMATTRRPLVERMTLFWHGTFTSAYRTVRDSVRMHGQNELLRRHALGSYADLLREVTRDPAMLSYLDGERNRREHPNENYAREVMELFTLGVGHYTEADVQEAARALTGWQVVDGRARLLPGRHDAGEKTILGRTAAFDDAGLCALLLEQPATSRRLASRLFAWFVHDHPDPAVVEALAAVLRATSYELRPALRLLLSSRAFHAPEARAAQVKSPVDLVVGLHRELAVPPGRTPLAALTRALGQEVLDPPSVKGWDGGEAWITSSSLLARYNAAAAVVGTAATRSEVASAARGGRGEQRRAATEEEEDDEARAQAARRRDRARAGPSPYDAAADVRARGLTTAEAVVSHYAETLLPVPLDPAARGALLAALGGAGPFQPDAPQAREQLARLLELIVSTPEFQLR